MPLSHPDEDASDYMSSELKGGVRVRDSDLGVGVVWMFVSSCPKVHVETESPMQQY
jgi:hypothetical protein